MFIPVFALRESERQLLSAHLTRKVTFQLAEKIEAYVVDEKQYRTIMNFVEEFRNSSEEITEEQRNQPLQSASRSNVLRAVSLVFNVLVDVQKIKDPDTRIAANASLVAAVMSVVAISPEYGNRLISILKSKI